MEFSIVFDRRDECGYYELGEKFTGVQEFCKQRVIPTALFSDSPGIPAWRD
jgi:hypothetical protein